MNPVQRLAEAIIRAFTNRPYLSAFVLVVLVMLLVAALAWR